MGWYSWDGAAEPRAGRGSEWVDARMSRKGLVAKGWGWSGMTGLVGISGCGSE